MNAIPSPPPGGSAERLAILVRLEQRARTAETPQVLAFVMVNDTRGLLDYRRALFWNAESRRLEACSGLAALDPQAPFALWLSRLCRGWQDRDDALRPHEIDAAALAADEREDWRHYVTGRLSWLPLRRRDGHLAGALLLDRDRPLAPAERSLVDLLLDGYGHAWSALHGRRRIRPPANLRSRRLWLGATAALVLLSLLPVRQSVLAPAEIVAHRPAVLRAPLQAVVEHLLVRPNQEVAAGEPVARLDTREWESRLQSSRQEFAVADAQFRQAQQQMLFDERGKAGLAALKGRLEQARADVAYIEDNLGRMLITAPRAGIAIYDDPSDWIGRPVALGERIMLIADPAEAELEILLPIADAIRLESGSKVRLFLNSEPGAPLAATLERIGYRAGPSPDGVMAYRLKAAFDGHDPRIRVGLKGTAKLYGDRTTLFGYLLRRPLSALRAYLGW
jgi:Membrane-fusion protein